MSSLVIFNGSILDEQKVCISINNRSFRYGDGCFETIKVVDKKIVLSDNHFRRLFSSLDLLQLQLPPFFNAKYLVDLIAQLTERNKHSSLARVRLNVFRGDGGLYEEVNHQPNFIIQSWAGNYDDNKFRREGLMLDFFPDAKKACDNFSGIKSNNYLPYILGALYARKHALDDCVILNCFNRVAETTIANVFIVNNGVVKTPALTEGCVNGVMRKYLIDGLRSENILVLEGEIYADDLLQASEVFLTNAMYGLRWVSKIANSNYNNKMSSFIHQKFIIPLFSPTTF